MPARFCAGRENSIPQIDRVTVYRTINLLKRHGLMDELDLMHMQGEKHYYERRPQRDHIHMACLRCGKITEFESDLFDRLKGQIQRDCQFHIVVTPPGSGRLLRPVSYAPAPE